MHIPSEAINLLARAEPTRTPPAPPIGTQCTDDYSYLPAVCYVVCGSLVLVDIVGLIFLKTFQNKKRKLIRKKYADRIDEKLDKSASWMPGWMKCWVSRSASRNLADREIDGPFYRN